MTPYLNRGGDSGVVSYEIGADSITVVFRTGRERNYLYNYQRPGQTHVDQMKILAAQGEGLNAYISSVVRSNFARKW